MTGASAHGPGSLLRAARLVRVRATERCSETDRGAGWRAGQADGKAAARQGVGVGRQARRRQRDGFVARCRAQDAILDCTRGFGEGAKIVLAISRLRML